MNLFTSLVMRTYLLPVLRYPVLSRLDGHFSILDRRLSHELHSSVESGHGCPYGCRFVDRLLNHNKGIRGINGDQTIRGT